MNNVNWKVTWYDYAKDKLHTEEINQEQLDWLRRQTHIEVDKVERVLIK